MPLKSSLLTKAFSRNGSGRFSPLSSHYYSPESMLSWVDSQFYKGSHSLKRAVGIDEDGYRTVVDEFHYHHGAKDATLDVLALAVEVSPQVPPAKPAAPRAPAAKPTPPPPPVLEGVVRGPDRKPIEKALVAAMASSGAVAGA